MGMDIRLAIPFLLSHTWKSLYVPFILVTIVQALHLPVIVVSLSSTSVRNCYEKKVWYYAQLLR